MAGQRSAPAILEQAEARSIDVIGLTTHGHRGLTRLLLGSVADKVIRGAPAAVLTYRPNTKLK
jgi:nucleotide-binding universal stress UspA family protein